MSGVDPPATPDPHALVGTWVGTGEGQYPTIDPFTYAETVTIAVVPGKPFLSYAQRTSHPDTGSPMHTEVGYLRFPPPAGDISANPGTGGLSSRPAEMTIAQPTGVTECHTGTLHLDDGLVLDLASASVGCTPTAKEVTSVRRRLEVRGDVLTYDLWMAAVGQPDTLHLRAVLHRQPTS